MWNEMAPGQFLKYLVFSSHCHTTILDTHIHLPAMRNIPIVVTDNVAKYGT